MDNEQIVSVANNVSNVIGRVKKYCGFGAIADTFVMASTKGIRLNEAIRKEFEDYCRVNLLDERAVIEAWLLRFLEASEEERKRAAARYTQWHEHKGKPDTTAEKKPVPSKRGSRASAGD
jgi:hypothetical protein